MLWRALWWWWRWVAVAGAVAWLLAAARPAGAAWCIARSGAAERTVQAALDYACGPAGGADCAPIQASGLCYLPNTLAAHASYAFNSVFQRARAAPGACDFAGTATITLTDPSYGSCTYPASPSTAGQSGSTGGIPSPPAADGGGLSPPDLGSGDDSGAAARSRLAAAPFLPRLALSCLLVYLLHTQRW
uniref:X8 domain-containing protein n=1 Tax=Oryza meridionalis TaxID=40149 RepID=A0A0E0CKV8_9ORYZ